MSLRRYNAGGFYFINRACCFSLSFNAVFCSSFCVPDAHIAKLKERHMIKHMLQVNMLFINFILYIR